MLPVVMLEFKLLNTQRRESFEHAVMFDQIPFARQSLSIWCYIRMTSGAKRLLNLELAISQIVESEEPTYIY